jgi:glucose-6-phosphate-specific signal transduction histidine kinase
MDPHGDMTESQRFFERLIVSTIQARDVESNRVSRLLHDEVGQVLTCGRTNAARIEARFRSSDSGAFRSRE